jgi:16S rRNA (cytidine1402-2'-O)-methyltransferase
MSGRHSSKNSKSGPAEAAGIALEPLADGLNRQLGKLCAAALAPGLYLVSTPIGNLADLTVRALFTLAAADILLCEDTRHSRKLLSAYGIERKLEAYHDFSGDKDRARILAALGQGKTVALISDAGTPLVADPGFKLVREALAEGVKAFAIPGPSAVLAALVTSGLPSDRFYFGGFLPAKDGARRDELERARTIPGTLIYYETGGRLEETLQALNGIFPDRPVAAARELTKLYETVSKGSAAELAQQFKENAPPGEFVILIGPGETEPATTEDIERALRNRMKSVSLKEAVEEVARSLGVGRKAVYNLALKLKE